MEGHLVKIILIPLVWNICFVWSFLPLTLSTAKSRLATCYIHSCTCSVFRAVIRCIKFLKRSTNALEYKNVILLHSNHQHVSAHSYGHLQGGERKSTITIIMSGWLSTNCYCNRILVLTTPQKGTRVAETCWWFFLRKVIPVVRVKLIYVESSQ